MNHFTAFTTMTTNEILERTRAYVLKSFLYTRPDFRLEVDASLLDQGIIDSMGIMELIEFIEVEFGVTVGDDEITEDNLGSLEAIAAFVAARRERPPTAGSHEVD